MCTHVVYVLIVHILIQYYTLYLLNGLNVFVWF